MTVNPASMSRPQPFEYPEQFMPFMGRGTPRGRAEDNDYVEEEWFASGEDESGHPYRTVVFVRRPRDRKKFSGTVIVEPMHATPVTPIWMATSLYIMRSGHGWAAITCQKTSLDGYVKPSSPRRYESLGIHADPPAEGASGWDLGRPILKADPATRAAFWAERRRENEAADTILAQVGAAIGTPPGPYDGWDVAHVLLVGHSQTGFVTTNYIREAHNSLRRADGSPVFHGFLPTGSPEEPFAGYDVPIVQVISEGDVTDPNYCYLPGYEGRIYRRGDSDEPGDRFRLYELAGVGHAGTRNPPFNSPELWPAFHNAGPMPADARYSTLPHFELFQMGLDRLVRWVADGVVPPRAARLEVGPDGFFAQDEHGNTLGGVRCVQMDVPRARYLANTTDPDGTLVFGGCGLEEPFDRVKLRSLYKDHFDYVERFNRRLDELIAAGWFLPEDADEMRAEAEKAHVP